MAKASPPILYTVGHSTRSFAELLALIQAHRVKHLIDIRTVPRSRHNPQFNKEAFAKALKGKRIRYTHMKELGGLRHASKDSINLGWHNASFRGYADYMQTDAFEKGLARLMKYASKAQVAIVCAEALPWRCHRSLVADALLARGWRVEHIFSKTVRKKHVMTSFAKIKAKRVFYPILLSAPD